MIGYYSSRPSLLFTWHMAEKKDILIPSVLEILIYLAIALFVLLGKTKVDQGQKTTPPTDSHQEVVGLDVAVDEPLAVHELDPVDHLVGQHQHCLHGELLRAEEEQVLEAGAQEIHHHHVVLDPIQLLHPKPVDFWDSLPTPKNLVDPPLVGQLRVPTLEPLQLDCHFSFRDDIDPSVDFPKSSKPNWLYKSVLLPDQTT